MISSVKMAMTRVRERAMMSSDETDYLVGGKELARYPPLFRCGYLRFSFYQICKCDIPCMQGVRYRFRMTMAGRYGLREQRRKEVLW